MKNNLLSHFLNNYSHVNALKKENGNALELLGFFGRKEKH
jgi:hypothetical protein